MVTTASTRQGKWGRNVGQAGQKQCVWCCWEGNMGDIGCQCEPGVGQMAPVMASDSTVNCHREERRQRRRPVWTAPEVVESAQQSTHGYLLTFAAHPVPELASAVMARMALVPLPALAEAAFAETVSLQGFSSLLEPV